MILQIRMKNIIQRENIYYFRLRVPKDCQDALGKKEIVKSLRTSDWKEAKQKAQESTAEWTETFTKILNPETAAPAQIPDSEPVRSDAFDIEAYRKNLLALMNKNLPGILSGLTDEQLQEQYESYDGDIQWLQKGTPHSFNLPELGLTTEWIPDENPGIDRRKRKVVIEVIEEMKKRVATELRVTGHDILAAEQPDEQKPTAKTAEREEEPEETDLLEVAELMLKARHHIWKTVQTVRADTGEEIFPPEKNRAAWLQDAKWGVMIHYQPEWLAEQNQLDPITTTEQWNELVDNFDCEGLAKQLADAGAGYLIMTVRHGPVFFISPNSAYDRITGQVPSRCSRRDLIADLADALDKYGIKLIAYMLGQAPCMNEAEIEGFGVRSDDYYRAGPFTRNAEALLRWQEVFREYSLRWGDKVSGWWIDACYRPNTMYRHPDAPNFESMAAAARAGNPDSIVTFNPGRFPRLKSITLHEDYIAGEVNEPDLLSFRFRHEGMIDGKQIHALSFLGSFWGQGEPRFTDEEVVKHSLKVREVSGAITWDCPVYPNGLIKEPFMKQLSSIGKAVN